MAPTKSKPLADFYLPKWSTQQPRRNAHRRGQISAVAPPMRQSPVLPPPPTRQSDLLLPPHPTPPRGVSPRRVAEPSRQRQSLRPFQSPNLASSPSRRIKFRVPNPAWQRQPAQVSHPKLNPAELRCRSSHHFQSPVPGSASETAPVVSTGDNLSSPPPPPPEQVAENFAVAAQVAPRILKFSLGKRKKSSQTEPPQPSKKASQTQPPQPTTSEGQKTAEDGGGMRAQEPPQQPNEGRETAEGGGKASQTEPPQPTSEGHKTAEDGGMRAQNQPPSKKQTLAGSSSGGGGAPATQPPATEPPKVKLPKLSLTLTPREIAEDLYSMGITTRPTRRSTKKRPTTVQNRLDVEFL